MKVMDRLADAKREVADLLDLHERDAWQEYLRCVRDLHELRYEELEPWAWAKLQRRLDQVHVRRAEIGL